MSFVDAVNMTVHVYTPETLAEGYIHALDREIKQLDHELDRLAQDGLVLEDRRNMLRALRAKHSAALDRARVVPITLHELVTDPPEGEPTA